MDKVYVTNGCSNHSEKDRETDDYYDIPGFVGRLQINKKGEVYSLISKKILKQSKLPSGYITITLMLNNPRRTKTLYLHRLLATTFIPNLKNKPTVNHKNGKKDDNRLENLEWATQSEQNKHAIENRLREPNFSKILEINKDKRKLTMQQALYVKKSKKAVREICSELNLDYERYKYIISDIKRGRTYKDA